MQLPFTLEQFLGVFAAYNRAIAPIQLLAYGLGMAAVLLLFSRRAVAHRVITAILALLWLWTGIIYHGLHFSSVNPVAYLFGALFVVEGLLLLYLGVGRRALVFHLRRDAQGILALLLFAYAMVIYPVLNVWFGHAYPAMPVFGVTPCPTTIYTLGFLLVLERSGPGPRCAATGVLIIPLLWSMVGTSAAFALGMVEDSGLLVAGIIAAATVMLRRRSRAV